MCINYIIILVEGVVILGDIIVSIFVKKGILSILIIEGGKLKERHVERIKDENILSSMYSSLIFGFTKALRITRNYLEKNNCSKVVFEVSNSVFSKWLMNRYSKEAYQKEFMELLEIIEAIPMQYSVVVNPKPQASLYAEERYLTDKLKLEGLF